jgi:hypothetical protein
VVTSELRLFADLIGENVPRAVGPVPVKEVPMGEVQNWIDELRAGKIVGRIILAN